MTYFCPAGDDSGPDIPQRAGAAQHRQGRGEGNPGMEREQTKRHRLLRRAAGRQQTSQRAGQQVSSRAVVGAGTKLWYCRGSTNMDLSRDEEGATQDRSNAPITNTNDPEQVTLSHYHKPSVVSPVFPPQISETKCCCFFKRKMRKKKSGRSK